MRKGMLRTALLPQHDAPRPTLSTGAVSLKLTPLHLVLSADTLPKLHWTTGSSQGMPELRSQYALPAKLSPVCSLQFLE